MMSTEKGGGVEFKEKEFNNWLNTDKYIAITYYRYKDYQDESKSTGNKDIDKFMKTIKNDVLAYYIDGVLYGYTGYGTASYDSGYSNWGGEDVPLFVGVCPWGAENFLYYLKGKVYTVRLYTRPLNSDEVQANYTQTLNYREALKKISE